MKLLGMLLIFMACPAWANQPQPKEVGLSDEELSRKVVGVITDRRVEGMIRSTSEFDKCRKEGKSETDALDCFKKELGNRKPEDLQSLSNKLGLESYGLVQSKNVQDITDYLTRKMYRALTNVEIDERDHQRLKQRQMVDQRIFIEMFQTRLQKNALLEISRFCFENLRKLSEPEPGDKDFTSYWGAGLTNLDVPRVTDTGGDTPASRFKRGDVTGDDEEAIYGKIAASIGNDLPPDKLNDFFQQCGKIIAPLCGIYEDPATRGNSSRGANACLAKARLKEIRNNIHQTEKILEDFNSISEHDKGIMLKTGRPEVYRKDGRGNQDHTLDNLTNFTATDMLKNPDEELQKKIKDCEENSGDTKCENFIAVSDDLDKAYKSTAREINFQREAELARIKDLKGKNLEDYLKDNGYFEILAELKDDPNLDIAQAVGRIFDAKRDALIAGMQAKMGKRQISKQEVAADAGAKTRAIETSVTEARDERGRLAQIVLFNNIVTSFLSLERDTGKGQREQLGRNVNPFEKEQRNLPSGQASLFQNLKNSTADGSGKKHTGEELMTGTDFIDQLLGKPAKNSQ
jgi:hypothetical protein